jgi:hypothetical protein
LPLRRLDGGSALIGEGRVPAGVAYTEMPALNSAKFRLAGRTEEHKTIHDVEKTGANQLYDLQVDPGERCNLYDKSDPLSRRFDQLRLALFAPILPQLLEIKNRPPE